MRAATLAAAAICLSVAAQFMMKAGMSVPHVRSALAAASGLRPLGAVLSSPLVLAGLLAYGMGAVLWLGVLARLEVSKAYPLVGAGFALTAVVGWLMGEQVSSTRVVGVLLICTGVVLVGRS